MRVFRTIIPIVILFLACLNAAGQTRVRFNPEYCTQDIRLEYGRLFALDGKGWDAPLVQGFYTRQFWRKASWRVGGEFALGVHEYTFRTGIPMGLVYSPGTVPLEERLAYAAGESVFDAVAASVQGAPAAIGAILMGNLLRALFRRTEFHIGITPGFFGQKYDYAGPTGGPFFLTADAGIVLSIPIWRFCLSASGTYHFSITNNLYYATGCFARNYLSVTGSLAYRF